MYVYIFGTPYIYQILLSIVQWGFTLLLHVWEKKVPREKDLLKIKPSTVKWSGQGGNGQDTNCIHRVAASPAYP